VCGAQRVLQPLTTSLSLAFAANRPIGLQCLKLLLAAGVKPAAILLGRDQADAMRALVPDVPVFFAQEFRQPGAQRTLELLNLQYILSVHFPYIIPQQILALPSEGALNLHPAFLPYNRGWHTATWAIEEGTPYGATLHWMDAGIDTGDIALQKKVPVLQHDTAHTLYQRALRAEIDVFTEALPGLLARSLPRIPQQGMGTMHRKADLATIQQVDPKTMTTDAFNRRVRALTTNDFAEAAYIMEDGKRVYLSWDALEA
jgi:methionyl-tRNA formyltransferase